MFFNALFYYYIILGCLTFIVAYRLIKRMNELCFFESHLSKFKIVVFFLIILFTCGWNTYRNNGLQKTSRQLDIWYSWNSIKELRSHCTDTHWSHKVARVFVDFHFT